jgi:hypothetical protein
LESSSDASRTRVPVHPKVRDDTVAFLDDLLVPVGE